MSLQEIIISSMESFVYDVYDFIDKMKVEINDKMEDCKVPLQIAHTSAIPQSIENIYDIYYHFLINKNEKIINDFTIGFFNYPNQFTIHINNTNYSMKVTQTTDKILITYLYYIDNILKVPVLGYDKQFKVHNSYESLIDDLNNICDYVICDQIVLY